MSQQSVFGKAKVSLTVTVIDPDGTVTVFDEKESQGDMGTPETRRAAAEAKQEKQ